MEFSDKFTQCINIVLNEEGGYVNNPNDNGGPTMRGITQRVYDSYRRMKGRVEISVKSIKDEELFEIYHNQYWVPINGDALPAGLDLLMLDYSVNSGPATATKSIQYCVGTAADGHMGSVTLSAIGDFTVDDLIEKLCERRLQFLRSLSDYKHFWKGWETRVKRIRASSLKRCGHAIKENPIKNQPTERATKATTTPRDVSGKSDKMIAIGTGAAGTLATVVSSIDSPYGVVALGMILALIGFAAWKIWPKYRMPEL